MRSGPKPEFVVLDGGVVVGVNLSSDSCSEHEWGISPMKMALGVDQSQGFGIERRRIRKLPEGWLQWRELSDGSQGFGLQSPWSWENNFEKCLERHDFRKRHIPRLYKTGPKKGTPRPGPGTWEKYGLAAAWGERDFFVRAMSAEDIANLRQIWEAIQAGNGAVWISGGGPFGGHGLFFMDITKIPQEYLDTLYEGDKEAHETKEYHDSTGIEKLLKDAGKGWFSLRPQRFPNGFTTRHGVVVDKTGGYAWWLNPSDQKNNEFGWYTLEELQAWARNEGPIPKRVS